MKRVLSLILIVLLINGSFVSAGIFTDMTQTDWFNENITVLVDEGIINGYGNGKFGPNDSMQVDQFIKTMIVALGYTDIKSEDYWAQGYIDKAIEFGIVEVDDFEGYSQAITRAQMAKLSVRVLGQTEEDITFIYDNKDNDLLLTQVTDREEILTSEDESYISQSYELGIITGYPDGSFKPNISLKRSEACTVIRRVIDPSMRQPFQATDYAIREQELLKDQGYMPFSNGLDDSVYTKQTLSNEAKNFSFDSGLRFSMDDKEQGTWSLTYTCFTHEDFPRAGNQEMQLYEAEYLLSNVIGLEDSIIEQVLEVFSSKEVKSDVTQTMRFTTSDNLELLLRGSEAVDWTIELRGHGFAFGDI